MGCYCMDKNTCEHKNKVFANFVYASYPAQHPWICKDCGYEGVYREQIKIETETYDSIKRKFKTNNGA